MFQVIDSMLNDKSEQINQAVVDNFSAIVAVFDESHR